MAWVVRVAAGALVLCGLLCAVTASVGTATPRDTATPWDAWAGPPPPWETLSPCQARVEAPTPPQREQGHGPVLGRPVSMAVHRVMHWLHWGPLSPLSLLRGGGNWR